MDKRSEPRFQIRSAINIAAIDHPEQVSEALLLDVSGAGLKIVADNWWPVNTCIVVELENHLVVARVRNIVARGPKFSLGAERLYSVLKHTMPSGVSRTVWHNLLRAEMRDLPATPERPTGENVESFEIAPPEIAGPVVTSSAIAEPEGVARKLTLRAPEPPKVVTTQPDERREAVASELPEAPATQPEAISNQELQTEVPPAIAAPVAALPAGESSEEEPAVTKGNVAETSTTEISVAEKSVAETRVVEITPETKPEPAVEQPVEAHAQIAESVALPPQENPTPAEPEVAGAIPETRPVIDLQSAPYQKQSSLEALPSAPLPQALPTLREPVVPIASESAAPAVPLDREQQQNENPQAQTVDAAIPPVEHESIRTREAVPALSRAEYRNILQAVDEDAITQQVPSQRTAPDLSNHESPLASTPAKLAPRPFDKKVPERRSNGQTGNEGQTDPPLGLPFRLSPTPAQSATAVATPELKPQFGPAYGLAPTAEGLQPISVMPELPALTPEPKPRSMFSTTVIAGVLGLAALALYYGPFRPKGSTTPRTQSVQRDAGPLTIPSVAEQAKSSTATSTALPTSAVAPVTAPAASVAATNNPPTSAAAKPEATAQTPVVPAPGVAAKPTPSPTMAKMIPPVVPAQNASPAQAVSPAQTPAAKVALPVAPASPVASTTTTPVKPRPTSPLPVSSSAGTRRVNITAASLLWFSACSDGKPAFAKVMHTGDTMDIDFHQAIVFKLGNSAAAQMILDGKPLGTLGAPGSVKVVELGAAGLRELPPTSTAGTECQPARAAAQP